MQGGKPDEEIQHVVISHVYAKSRGRVATRLSEEQFRTPCETTPCKISHGLRNLPMHRIC